MSKIDMLFFPSVRGSMTSPDGATFCLHVEREDGGDLMLGFPHSEIANLVENAAMQAGNGKDAKGRKNVSAFKATSFELGRGSEGQPVLVMYRAECNARVESRQAAWHPNHAQRGNSREILHPG